MKSILFILAATLAIATANSFPGYSYDSYAYSGLPGAESYPGPYGYPEVGSESYYEAASDPLTFASPEASAVPFADPSFGYGYHQPWFRRPYGGYRRPFGDYRYRRPSGYYGYRRPIYGYRRPFYG